MPDGRRAIVFDLLFSRARIGIGPARSKWFEGEW
jgi:hypothetical protein